MFAIFCYVLRYFPFTFAVCGTCPSGQVPQTAHSQRQRQRHKRRLGGCIDLLKTGKGTISALHSEMS